MISRYARPEAAAIWSPQTKYSIWFEIEAHATTALAQLGVVPREAAEVIWNKGSAATFDVARIDEIERTTKHDVIAFLTHVAEIVGACVAFALAQPIADIDYERARVALQKSLSRLQVASRIPGMRVGELKRMRDPRA